MKNRLQKKIGKIILWGIVGLIVGFILHGIIEIIYLNIVDPMEVRWVLNGACSLPLWVIFGLPIITISTSIYFGYKSK